MFAQRPHVGEGSHDGPIDDIPGQRRAIILHREDFEEMRAMFNFFNGEGYDADIPALRKIYPGLLTLEQYLRKNGWENAQPVPMPDQSRRG